MDRFIPINTKRRSGQKNKGIKFIVCHDTANDGATALSNVNYYIKSANEMESSAHAFVDADGVIWCIPADEKAWHVRYNVPIDNELYGGDANDYALGIELCYSTKGIFDSKKAYNNYCQLMADLCKKYSLSPDKQLVGHYKLDPTRRTDPLNAFMKIGKNWTTFIADVKVKMGEEEMATIQVPKRILEKVKQYIETL